jgi:hypothetical protein
MAQICKSQFEEAGLNEERAWICGENTFSYITYFLPQPLYRGEIFLTASV